MKNSKVEQARRPAAMRRQQISQGDSRVFGRMPGDQEIAAAVSALAERYRTASESFPHWIRCTRSLGNHWRLIAPAKVWWVVAFGSLVLEADRPTLASGVPQGMKEIAQKLRDRRSGFLRQALGRNPQKAARQFGDP